MRLWLKKKRMQLAARKKRGRATGVILTFFVLVILLGTGLLMLPVSSKTGQSCGFMTALFTATSASCVTGLSLVDSFTQWSDFGQVVLLLLIQFGGLGYMLFVSVFYFLLRRKIGLRERLVLQQSMALDEMEGLSRLVRLVLIGTFSIEALGAVVLSLRFSLDFPVADAIWMGVFHSISAFCNAGFDLMGRVTPGGSLTWYSGDPVVTLTMVALIIVSGLGFFVWNDILVHKKWKRLTVYSRLVLIITAGLILGGFALFLLLEWENAFGGVGVGGKILSALFQSVTLRTAGFAMVDQAGLTEVSKAISIVLMLIGGSSGSTAGGMKTVTVGLVFLLAGSTAANRRQVTVFGRTIPREQLDMAVSIVMLVAGLALVGGMVISVADGVALLDGVFEAASAIATVGMSTGITSSLCIGTKLMLCVYMFFGRVGILTIGVALMSRGKPTGSIIYPETHILIG